MSMTPEQQRSILQKESAWIDADQFAPLDLSAYPALNELPPERSRDDGRFAREYGDTALNRSAGALRRFLDDPGTEVLAQVAQETGNEDYARDVRDRRGEVVATEFKRRCPQYLPTATNFRTMVSTLAFNALPNLERNADTSEIVQLLIEQGCWTPDNLIAVYDALSAEGLLQIPAGQPRNLTERERLRVSRMAQAGRVDEAIGEYLRCALDGEEPDIEMLNDPAYRAVCNDAVLTVFEEITLDYVPTPERQGYLLRHCGDRPLTLALLQQAWRACQANEQRHQRGELLNSFQQPESPTNLDALDDGSIENLYHQSLRAYAEQFRRAPGVLV